MNNKSFWYKSLLPILFISISSEAAPLYLSEAYELAIKNNHAYRSKHLESDSVQYAQEQRESKLYPQIQLALNGGLHDYVQNYTSQTEISEIYKSYTLSLSQPLYHPEIFISIDQGNLRTEGAETETYKSSQDLGIDVAKAYFELISARQSLELAHTNHRFYLLKYTRIEQMLVQGLSNKMDLLDTQLYRDRASIEINVATKKEFLARRKLENLILVPISELPALSPVIKTSFESVKRYGTEELTSNPDLKLAILSRRIAQHEIDIRTYDHYPKIDLSLSRTQNDTNDRVVYKTDNRAFIQISIPIYQGGYTRARVNEARLLHDAAIEKEAETQQNTLYRLEELTQEYDLNIQNLAILDTARTSAELNFHAIEVAQKSGLKSQVDLLEARAKLYQIEQDRLKQITSLGINHITLLGINGKVNSENLHTFEKQLFE
ncbi:MAG: TolC family protein [Sulfuricurvum sp.]|nr:TolC family protein [Sulfuricurvum sp.]